jgi:hypothetical protein
MKNKYITVLSLMISLLSGFAMAQEEISPVLMPDVTQTDPVLLQRIAALVESGQYEQARVQLMMSRMQPLPHLEVLFLSGRIYAGIGDFRSAADEFRLMLTRDATLIRPRLELAHALFMSRDYEGGSYHFQQVMAGNLPDDVRSKVQGFLTAIREQLPSYNFNFDVVNDSNPKQSTNSKTVTIGGRSYQLSTTAPDKTIWGVTLGANANIPLPGDPSWFVRSGISLTDYQNKDSDQLYVQATAGRHFRFNANTVTLEAGGQLFDYRDRKLYSGALWRAGDFWRQSDRSNWQILLQGAQQEYPDYTYQSGWQYTFSLENQLVQSANSRWQTGASYSRNQARELPYAFSSPSVYLHYVHEWQGGIITGARVQEAQLDYWGDDPFFGVRRSDREHRVEVVLVNRNWQYSGLSPRLLLGRIEHASNMTLYGFRRNYIKIGVSREF